MRIKKRILQKIFSSFSALILLVNSVVPYIPVPVAYSTEPLQTNISFSNNSFQISANTSEALTYLLAYKTPENIEGANATKIEKSDDSFSKEIYAGIKSGSDSRQDEVIRGIYKLESGDSFNEKRFTFEDGSLKIVDETTAGTMTLTDADSNWLETGTDTIEQTCDTETIDNNTYIDWDTNLDEKTSKTKEKVKVGVTYIFPLENKVTVKFSCLPKNEALRTTLKIQQVKVADLNLPDSVNPATEYAYDITTGMKDGSFKYEVTLPKVENQEAEVSYIEKTIEEIKETPVTMDEIKSTDENKTFQETDKVKVTDLDHFTTFFTLDSDCTGGCQPSHTITSKPDLIVTKSNDVDGKITLNNTFTWKLRIKNTGNKKASFKSYNYFPISQYFENIVEDYLPSNATYGPPSIIATDNISGTASIACSINSNILKCEATGPSWTTTYLDINPSGYFEVSFKVTPTQVGQLKNPRDAFGRPPDNPICKVDPDNINDESNERNNDCSDNVQITELEGLITIIKDAQPNDSQDFKFDGNLDPNPFYLDDDTDNTLPNSITFSKTPGTYNVTEDSSVSGWTLESINCTGGSDVNIHKRSVTIKLKSNEDVKCTFINTRKTAPLHVQKFEDKDGDGVGEAGEDRLENWVFKVYEDSSCAGSYVTTNPTDNYGETTVNDLYVGKTYWVKEIYDNTVWTNTTGDCKNITIADTTNNMLGFGNRKILSDVMVCKTDSGNNPLSGWRMILRKDIALESFDVSSQGTVVSKNYPTGNYALIASGIYNYGNSRMDADAANSYRYVGLPCAGTTDNWVNGEDSSCMNNYLSLNFSSSGGPTAPGWGTYYNPNHIYAKSYVGGDIDFKIWDSCSTTGEGCYGDNEGSLNVKIYDGYVGNTDTDGCVTFKDVPLGKYQLEEILQDSWANDSGTGLVTIDDSQETFTVVNHQMICGNGIRENNEECDDGNSDNTDDCLNTCELPTCDDGYIWNFNEDCDDGAANGQTCTPPYGGTCNYCSTDCETATVDGPYCGDRIINEDEECDGNVGVTVGKDFCTNTCKLIKIYDGTHECPEGTEKSQDPIVTLNISSLDVDGETYGLTASEKYLFEASEDYSYGQGRLADAAYAATGTSWTTTIRSDVGIWGTYRGVTSLIGNLGDGVGLIEWDDDDTFNSDHTYYKYFSPTTDVNANFLISDWFDSWYSDYSNQSGMEDNSESLTLKIFKCEEYGKVVVTKYHDNNLKNGVKDSGELVLQGWEINLDDQIATTSADGTAIFDNLLAGTYKLSEKNKEGWRQTSIYCDGEKTKDSDNTHTITVKPGETTNCYIGNYHIPRLRITKKNNLWPYNGSIGGQVTFTVQITSEEDGNDVNNVHLVDLLPNGFTFNSGSATKDGSPMSTQPVYHSPGDWNIGTVNEGETVELAYTATISSDQEPGLYKDLAYAYGCETAETCSVTGSTSVLATAGTEGKITDNYVGTQVNLAKEQQDTGTISVEKEESQEGEVLGASTGLPSTGGKTVWMIISLLLLVFGIAAVAFGIAMKLGKIKFLNKILVLVFILLGILFFGKNDVSAQIANPLTIRLEQPQSPTRLTNFKLIFTTMDMLGRDITVKCFSDDVQFGGDIEVTPGGNTGYCQINSSVMSTNNHSYAFKVIAYAGTDTASDSVIVNYSTDGPDTPSEYGKDHPSDCRYKIHFKTANDNGKTVKVEIYRSKETSFGLDASNRAAVIDIGSNTEHTETDNLASECDKKWYYALRAYDIYGNASDWIGDSEITVTTTTTTTTTTSTTTGQTHTTGAIPVVNVTLSSAEVLGEKTTAGTEKKAKDQKEEKVNILGTTTKRTNKNLYIEGGIGLLVLAIIGYGIYKKKNSKLKTQS